MRQQSMSLRKRPHPDAIEYDNLSFPQPASLSLSVQRRLYSRHSASNLLFSLLKQVRDTPNQLNAWDKNEHKIYPQMGQNLRLFIWAASIDITSRSSVSSQNKISKTRRNVWLITIILEMNYKYFLFSVCFNCVCFCLSFCFWQYKLLMFLWPVWYFVLCSFYNEMVEHLPLCVKKKKNYKYFSFVDMKKRTCTLSKSDLYLVKRKTRKEKKILD